MTHLFLISLHRHLRFTLENNNKNLHQRDFLQSMSLVDSDRPQVFSSSSRLALVNP